MRGSVLMHEVLTVDALWPAQRFLQLNRGVELRYSCVDELNDHVALPFKVKGR